MLPNANRLGRPPVSQRSTPRQVAAIKASEHNPEQLYQRKGLMQMTHGQLRDYTATKGLGRTQPARASVNPSRYRLIKATGIGMQRNKLL